MATFSSIISNAREKIAAERETLINWFKQQIPNSDKIQDLDQIFKDPEFSKAVRQMYEYHNNPAAKAEMDANGIIVPKISDIFSARRTDAEAAFGTEAVGQGAQDIYNLAIKSPDPKDSPDRYTIHAKMNQPAFSAAEEAKVGTEAYGQRPSTEFGGLRILDNKGRGFWLEFRKELPLILSILGFVAGGYLAGAEAGGAGATTAGGTTSAAQLAEMGTAASLAEMGGTGASFTGAAGTTASSAGALSSLPEVPSSAGLGEGAFMTGNTQLGTGVQTLGTGTPGYLGAGNVPVTGLGELAGVTLPGATSSGLNALTLSQNVPALNYTPNIPGWDLGSLGDQITGVPVNPNAPTPPTGIYNNPDTAMPDTFDLDAGPGSGSGGGLPPEAAAGAPGIWDKIKAGLGGIGENLLGSEGLGNIFQTGIEGYFDYRGLDAIRDATERGREDVETWTNRGLGYLEPFIHQDPSQDPYMQAALADISKQVQSSAAARGMLQSGQTLQNISDTTMARAYLPYRGQNIGAAQSAGGLATGAGGNLATLAGKSGEATANWWSGLGRNIGSTISQASGPSLAEQFGQISQGMKNLQDLWNSFGSKGA
jgi:hypothetical protein